MEARQHAAACPGEPAPAAACPGDAAAMSAAPAAAATSTALAGSLCTPLGPAGPPVARVPSGAPGQLKEPEVKEGVVKQEVQEEVPREKPDDRKVVISMALKGRQVKKCRLKASAKVVVAMKKFAVHTGHQLSSLRCFHYFIILYGFITDRFKKSL